MRILALETSTELCAVAVCDGDRWLERTEQAGQRHSELLVPLVRDLLADAQIALHQLDGIAFAAGPGSFTGLRIGCGVAQGLALGADLPLVGIQTLEAIAEVAREQRGLTRVVAAIDARMQEVYIAAYDHDGTGWQVTMEPAVARPGAVAMPPGSDWHGAGNAYDIYPALRERLAPVLSAFDGSVAPSASAVGRLALPRFATGAGVPARDAAPLYVRHRVALTSAERASGSRL
jgi:tRNA threonylcarbamoyladenosine biosynthesis protein TsaB